MNSADRNGSNGGQLITSAEGAVTGQLFSSVDILDDNTVFTVFVNPSYSGAAITSRTWMRGDRIWGCTTDLTIDTGSVLAHTRV